MSMWNRFRPYFRRGEQGDIECYAYLTHRTVADVKESIERGKKEEEESNLKSAEQVLGEVTMLLVEMDAQKKANTIQLFKGSLG